MVKRFDSQKVNLHTHSYYCGHGVGELHEYVDVAIKEGLEVLGFSEHCPMPDNRWPGSRMHFDRLEQYLGQCRDLQSAHTDITLLTGLECDYEPIEHNWYSEYLLDSNRVDYLIAGVHYLTNESVTDRYIQHFPNDVKALHLYTDQYIETLMSGLFSVGVHPDLFGMFYDEWDDEATACSRSILECAASLQIPLEINGYGLNKPTINTLTGKRRQYPLVDFWQLSKEYPIKVVANSDAHRPKGVVSQVIDAYSFAKEHGLELASFDIETETDGKVKLIFS